MIQSIFSNLSDDDVLLSLPSPKVRPKDRTGVQNWNHFYTAFSENFAMAAIENLSCSNKDLMLDPFLGSGTSLVAASKIGVSCVGVELSPFSALLARAKVSFGVRPANVHELLQNGLIQHIDIPLSLRQWYSAKDIMYAHSVMSTIAREVGKSKREFLYALVDDPTCRFDDLVVSLVAMLISTRTAAKIAYGSNPVWMRSASKGEILRRPSLSKLAANKATQMLQDLRAFKKDVLSSANRILLGDARSIAMPDKSIDFIVTSPPYLNRLDYVVSQRPELLILSIFCEIDLCELRKSMIGTTKIVEKGDPEQTWGKTCLSVLEKIRTHRSKASDTYYIWNYYKYFKDMYQCLKEMRRVAKPEARGVLVIQNSYYKDLSIPVSRIFIEMGESLDIQMTEIKAQSVKVHMGLLSPRQRYYSPGKTLQEVVLLMRF
jgi:DNA modification methylase